MRDTLGLFARISVRMLLPWPEGMPATRLVLHSGDLPVAARAMRLSTVPPVRNVPVTPR